MEEERKYVLAFRLRGDFPIRMLPLLELEVPRAAVAFVRVPVRSTLWSVNFARRIHHLGGMIEGTAERTAAEPVAALRVACPVPKQNKHVWYLR